MSAMMSKLAWGLVKSLLTEQFAYRFLIRGLWWAAQQTENQLDDGYVEDAAKCLGVEDYK